MKINNLLFKGVFLGGILALISVTNSQYMWWGSRYSGPVSGSQDTSCSIACDNTGNIYVAGWSNGFSTGSDIILIKYNSLTGDSVWVKRITGPGSGEDKVLAMTTDESGFIYLTGFIWQASRDILTVKLDGSGNIMWQNTFDGNNNGGDYGFAVETDASGNVYVAGRIDDNGNQHFTVLKYNTAGLQQWAAVYNGPLSGSFDQVQSIAVQSTGSIFVTGFTTSLQNFHTADYLTLKYDQSGNLAWAKRYNGSGNDEDVPVSIKMAGNDVIVTGRSDSLNGNYNFYTVKYKGSNGDSLASAYYCGTSIRQIDNAVAMTADGLGNFYVTGYSYGTGNNFDYATVKYNSNLQQQWAARFEGTGADYPARIITFGTDVYVTGSGNLSGSSDFLTVKYNSSGTQLWAMQYNGAGGGNDYATCLAADQFGNIFVTGYALTGGSENDIYTIRYSPNPISIQPVSGSIPSSYKLYQNYPNPFNPSTNIRIDIPAGGGNNAKLIVYDVLGRQVALLINQNLVPGSYLITWQPDENISSGIFFYKLISGDFVKTNKMIKVE